MPSSSSPPPPMTGSHPTATQLIRTLDQSRQPVLAMHLFHVDGRLLRGHSRCGDKQWPLTPSSKYLDCLGLPVKCCLGNSHDGNACLQRIIEPGTEPGTRQPQPDVAVDEDQGRGLVQRLNGRHQTREFPFVKLSGLVIRCGRQGNGSFLDRQVVRPAGKHHGRHGSAGISVVDVEAYHGGGKRHGCHCGPASNALQFTGGYLFNRVQQPIKEAGSPAPQYAGWLGQKGAQGKHD